MAVAIVLIVLIVAILSAVWFMTFQKWKRWEAALEHIAKSFKGKYTKGFRNGFAFGPGYVDARIDGHRLSIKTESESQGSSGNTRQVQFMVIEVTRGGSKPEYLGPARAASKFAETVDYSESSKNNKTVSVSGATLECKGLDSKLRGRLGKDQSLADAIGRLVAAGGYIERGNLVVRSRRFLPDPQALEKRVREVGEVATLL